jgi:uncharacterized surface protein with fasciclin (FAS1) repeats
MKKFLALGALALSMAFPTFAADKDIVDIAMSDPKFSTLVTAVKEAGLVETLKGAGPFTVFAPTNDAFAKVPGLSDILKDKAKLTAILTYHVVPGKVMAADVVKMDGKSAKTVQGSEVKVMIHDGKPMVGNAHVIKTDIKASNGVIHVIDSVLVP